MKAALVAFLILASTAAEADLNDCTGVYVGRIWVEQGSSALKAVVLLASPSAPSGSYWAFFSGWSADELKGALALLTAAKISQHRVDVLTTEPNQCNVLAGGTTMKAVFLSTNP